MKNFLILLCLILLTFSGFAATYTVTNTNNTGAGSLRQAITDANANVGADTIAFNIPAGDSGYDAGTGAWTIRLTSQLPTLTDNSTHLNGTTQTGYAAGAPVIELKGSSEVSEDGLRLAASFCTIEGLVINQFRGDCILIYSTGGTSNEVKGNYIGTDVAGTAASVVAGVFNPGIFIYDGAKYNVIGGTTVAARNLISGNLSSGIRISGSGTNWNKVLGNYIGTDKNGTAALGNSRGIAIQNGAQFNQIGGSVAGAGNIISGSNGPSSISYAGGIEISGLNTNSNEVEANYIGTDKNGTAALPNRRGVMIYDGPQFNVVGGASAAERNIISGNERSGVWISGYDDYSGGTSEANRNIVTGNYIGTDVSGAANLGNGRRGVDLTAGVKYNTIGGSTTAAGNTIAYNGADGSLPGIGVTGEATDFNTISHNSIFQNAALGIDLAPPGVTLNDSVGHTGPNQNLNFPLITSAAYNAGTGLTAVYGTADVSATVELFIADLDPSGYGQGKTFLASVVSDASGNWSTTVSGLTSASTLTATATDTNGNTSEFCQNFSVTATSPATSTTSTTTTTTTNQKTSGKVITNIQVSRDTINLNLNPATAETLTIRIYNANGENLKTETINVDPSLANNFSLNFTKGLPRGIYLIVILRGDQIIETTKTVVN